MQYQIKYGGWRGLNNSEVYKKSSVRWRDLVKTYGEEGVTKWFEGMMKWKLGNGKKTFF